MTKLAQPADFYGLGTMGGADESVGHEDDAWSYRTVLQV